MMKYDKKGLDSKGGMVGKIFPCTQFSNKTDCGVWEVQLRVLARRDVGPLLSEIVSEM